MGPFERVSAVASGRAVYATAVADRVAKETQGGGVILTRTYDFAGRVEQVRANGILYGQSFYDGIGFPGGTRPKGKLTQRMGYNPAVAGAPAVTESFSYSGIGGRLSQKDVAVTGMPLSLGTVTETWGYNTLGLLSTHTLPRRTADTVVTATTDYLNGFPNALKVNGADAVTQVTYHPHGGVKTWKAGNNVVTTNAADASLLPRPGSISGGTFSSGAYSYDGAGNIRGIGTNVFGYDLRSRLTSSTVSGQALSYGYDRYGNLNPAGVSGATNRLSAGTYDSRGNLTALGTQRYDYDALSRQTAFNGGVERYVYDGAGERIARVTAPSAGADLFTLFPCRLFDTRGPAGPYGQPALAAGESRTYTVTGQCGVPSDAVGVTANLLSISPSAAGFFKLVPAGTAPMISTLNYAAGRTLANNVRLPLSGNGQATLSTSAGSHALLDLTGYYKLLAPTWTVTYRDEANRLSTEYTVTSSVITRTKNYFHFGGMLVGLRQTSGEIWSFVSDHLGTPRRVFNGAGSQVEAHDYHPFGQEITGSFGNQPVKFAAMERDASSTKDYVHARYFGSLEGRFLSPDKVQGKIPDPQSWNRYSYARNNPLRFTDPDGREIVDITFRHFIQRPSVVSPFGRLAGDNRGFSLNPRLSSRTEQRIRVETDPLKSRDPLISQSKGAGPTSNLTFGFSGQAQAGSLDASVMRAPSGAVVITATQNEGIPKSAAFGLGTGSFGITSATTITIDPSASNITASGIRSDFPSLEINVNTESGQSFSLFQGQESSSPFGLFTLTSFSAECTNASTSPTCTQSPPRR